MDQLYLTPKSLNSNYSDTRHLPESATGKMFTSTKENFNLMSDIIRVTKIFKLLDIFILPRPLPCTVLEYERVQQFFKRCVHSNAHRLMLVHY
jgi:hypothetical protein